MDTNYGAHPTHYTAADNYAAAEEALYVATGLYITAAVAHYGSLAAVAIAHPNIAPGFSGFQFTVTDNRG